VAAGNTLHFAITAVDHFAFVGATVSHIGFASSSALIKRKN